MKVLIYSLGVKGFSVLKSMSEASSVQTIHCIIGQDESLTDDCSSDVMKYCENNEIRYTFRNDASLIKGNYDLFLAVGWRWIIRDVPQEKLVIFHDSLLPKYRGFAPLVNALINKEKVTGVTVLLGADQYDRGNILLQKSISIDYPTDIEHEIHRISNVYADLAVELFEKFGNGSINRMGYSQDESEATYSLWRNEDDYRIDWNDAANNIQHFITCVGSPYKGASAILNDSTIRVIKAQVREDVKIENRTPGKVIFVENNSPVVVCGSGLLALIDVRDEQGESVLPMKKFRSKFH